MTESSLTQAEYEGRRRRLEAEAEDARKAFVDTRAHYDRACEELRELRLAWAKQQHQSGGESS